VRAVDTNVLVHAHLDSPHSARARDVLARLAEGRAPWAVPWPCAYEFLRVVTHPRVFHPPMPLDTALKGLRAVLDSPTLVLLSETDRHAEIMAEVLRAGRAAGNLVHDAHIVALCLEHGVTEILTGGRDFSRFPGLAVTDPFA
jgi:toxin-antitoxin system PIN domain toxin